MTNREGTGKNVAAGDVTANGAGTAQGGSGNIQQTGNIINNFVLGRTSASGDRERHLSLHFLLILGGILVLISLIFFSDAEHIRSRLQAIGGSAVGIGFVEGMLNMRKGLDKAVVVNAGVLLLELLLSVTDIDLRWYVFPVTILLVVLTLVDYYTGRQGTNS